ncbi:MAG: 30S ribosomal protein S6 [Candidatus Methylomirabilales bacterium]
MRDYEIMVIYDPILGEEAIDGEVETLKALITREGGEVLEVQKWGKRRLAYEMYRKREGIYVLLAVRARAEVLTALHHHAKLQEQILRHVAVRVRPKKPVEVEQRAAAGMTPGGRGGGRS